MELTLVNVITLAATTGVFTAILNQVLSGFREWRLESGRKEARAGYHALRLAIMLEAYAYACAEFISKNGNADTPPDQEFPNWDVTLPELPPYPDDVEGWHAIDIKLAGRTLNLRNRINGSQGIIASVINFTEHELGETLDMHAAGRGLEAWRIATDLRRENKLDAVDLIWDFVETMENALQAAESNLKAMQESNLALFAAGQGIANPS